LTTRHCMIATCSTPRVPMTAYPISFAISPNHRLLTTGLMTLISSYDASTTCSLLLRPSYLLTPLYETFTSELSPRKVTLL
jgi:hypothetical protein